MSSNRTDVRLILADVGELIEDQEVEAVETIDGCLQRKLAARHLKPLYQVGGAREHHAPAILHQSEADGRGKMRLPAAWSADKEHVGAFVDPAVSGTDRHDVRLGDHRDHIEVEAVEGFFRQQLRLGEMAREAATVSFGDFVLGEHGKEARGGPAFPSASSAKPCQSCLIAGRRRSLSISVSRALSMFGFMPPLPHLGPCFDPDRRRAAPRRRSARQKIDHQAACRFLRELFEQSVEGQTIGVAGEQLVAVDEIEQRHGLASQGVDHMAIIDDVGPLAAGRGPFPPEGHQQGGADEHVEAIVVKPGPEPMTDEP